MLNFDALLADLADAGLAEWQAAIRVLLKEKLRDGAHGRLREWTSVLRNLPSLQTGKLSIDMGAVSVPAIDCDSAARVALRDQLLKLSPWRKGPFDICGVRIDSEWRSDMKWARIEPHISPLTGRVILDVGCGNGYYALRMSASGARSVIGIDPTLQYVAQFQAVQHYVRQVAVHLLPLRLGELPSRCRAFDTTFSMGVLYHQRNPLEHLQQLRESLRPGGELVLETLILPGEHNAATSPPDRYARMRNVWLLPTLPMLLRWIDQSGFKATRVVDVSVTTTGEQRSTEWMKFDSLAQALDPLDPDKTVEGWPRPRRAVLATLAPS